MSEQTKRERNKEYGKEWRRLHPGYSTQRYRNFTEEQKSKHIEMVIKREHTRTKECRNEIIDLLGSKCIRCGYTDRRALQIDHIYGGGREAQRTLQKINMVAVILFKE